MNNKLFLKTILILTLFVFNSALAGFGISPPSFKDAELEAGTSYEKEFRILRSTAESDLKINIKIEAEEIKDWISIKPSKEFILSKGETESLIIVQVDVPQDAEAKNYLGNIRITPESIKDNNQGVGIISSLSIGLDLTVITEKVDISLNDVSSNILIWLILVGIIILIMIILIFKKKKS